MTRTIVRTISVALLSLFVSNIAIAEYKLTAFGDSTAYAALINQDVDGARAKLRFISMQEMDFADANNLCVAEVLEKDFAAAVAACELALERVELEPYISLLSESLAKASIYSNLAVAKALAGDLSAASSYLELSLSLNDEDANALSNYDLISASLVAQN